MCRPVTGVPPRSNRIGLPISTGTHGISLVRCTISCWSARTSGRSDDAMSKPQSPYSRKNRISVPAATVISGVHTPVGAIQ
jgi:hypothetical protein